MGINQMLMSVQKFTLREPMTIEELHSLMTSRWKADLPGKFKLKKGLFGSYIRFDTYLTIQPRIKVKNNVVQVTRMTVKTKVGGVDLKAASQMLNAVKGGGGIMNVALGGPEYFLKVCAEMQEVLKDKIAG